MKPNVWPDVLETFLLMSQIRVTLRITGSRTARALIKLGVWHLDVGSNCITSATGFLLGELILLRLRELGSERCKSVWSISFAFHALIVLSPSTQGLEIR